MGLLLILVGGSCAFLFRVSTPEGNHEDIPPQDYRRGDIVMSGVAKNLKPQQKFVERIILNEWDIPERPGTTICEPI